MKVISLPRCSIAYLRRTGAYGAVNRTVMERLLALAGQESLLGSETSILSIAWDDPARTPPAACRYDACLVLQKGQTLPGTDVRYGSLPGGRYAVFTIPHTEQAVSEAWHTIGRLLLETGCTADSGRPVMERYTSAGVKDGICEFCIPVI
ncbi:MAG: GyrI-like domain-containing protein [Clostridiaceae bacterium]|nr:GyrI-like domain-containing protein [Clostridiaceae bacterium]